MCTGWTRGERRRFADLICCPHCGSVAIFRRGSKDGTAHWRCRDCAGHWTEDLATGRGKACTAKLDSPLLAPDWEPGQRRLRALLVCCPACGCSKVRCSSTRSLIGYWYCSHCRQGWIEGGQVGRDSACRVKLPEAYAGWLPQTVAA